MITTKEKILEETQEKFLENEIHKTSLKMTESEMVKKKYGLILDMLKREQLSYTKQINQMEAVEEGQTKEIEVLENDYTEAVSFRDEVRGEQKEWEDFFVISANATVRHFPSLLSRLTPAYCSKVNTIEN